MLMSIIVIVFSKIQFLIKIHRIVFNEIKYCCLLICFSQSIWYLLFYFISRVSQVDDEYLSQYRTYVVFYSLHLWQKQKIKIK